MPPELREALRTLSYLDRSLRNARHALEGAQAGRNDLSESALSALISKLDGQRDRACLAVVARFGAAQEDEAELALQTLEAKVKVTRLDVKLSVPAYDPNVPVVE